MGESSVAHPSQQSSKFELMPYFLSWKDKKNGRPVRERL